MSSFDSRVQVRFLQDSSLSLVHIPLTLYPHFLDALITLLVPDAARNGKFFGRTEIFEFINISLTPVECSVVCPRDVTEKFFKPIIEDLSPELKNTVSISPEDFVAIQVEGEELNAGQRVLDLSSPLALVGVPIFFISTYFSDYILVPARRRSTVITALQQRGFVFEHFTDSFVTQSSHERKSSIGNIAASTNGPPSPPITASDSLSDLESRTFSTLARHSITPLVDATIKLRLCGAQFQSPDTELEESLLELGLIKSLISKPRFMSVTITNTEPPSILLQEEFIKRYFLHPQNGRNLLMGGGGGKEGTPAYCPIVLDLKELPEDTTGIVCGLAGRLVAVSGRPGEGGIEMSYLSTARTGVLMVTEEDLERAVAALRFGDDYGTI